MSAVTIDIIELYRPAIDSDSYDTPFPTPSMEGYNDITLSFVEIDGKVYEKYEYIPDWVDLCTGGNAIREGAKVRILKPDEQDD